VKTEIVSLEMSMKCIITVKTRKPTSRLKKTWLL